jgi:murein L,D-transpeptidase YafK
MRRRSLIPGLLFLVATLSCCWAQDVPSSPQAEQVIARVAPSLVRALRARGLHYGAPIFLRIFKASKELEIWVQAGRQFRLFRLYTICAISGELGPKEQEGDLQSPEGFYAVTPEQMNPDSHYHLAFNLGYPNAYDQAYSRTGSALMVHGNCVSAGCYAMTDTDIEEIYTLADAALRNGQPSFAVHIFPFRMSQKKLRHFRSSRWLPFWLNLKEGYDHFVRTRRPPLVLVHEQRYVFAQPGSQGGAYRKILDLVPTPPPALGQ